MNKPTFMSVDTGNKNLKVVMDGMPEPLIIYNVQLPATALNSKTAINVFKKQQVNPINALDVTVTTNGKNLGRRYIGGLAVKHGGEERALRKEKHNDEDILFSALTVMAFVKLQSNPSAKKHSYRVCLGSCLPTYEYIEAEKVQEHEARFVGTHKVEFHDPCFNGATVEMEIFKDEVITLPEGSAAILNVATDDSGNTLPEYEDMEDRIEIVIDIGGGTTDISAIMNYEPVDELIDYMDKGILHAEEKIINTLKRVKPGFVITKSELDYFIRKRDCKLIDQEKDWDVKNYVEVEFASLSREIATKVNNLIQIAPDNMKRKIRRVRLTGGASLLLSEYIKSEIIGYSVVPSTTSLNDNVLGGLKAIKAKMAMKSAGEDEVFQNEENAG
jgi:plasmid segregation protein ParM